MYTIAILTHRIPGMTLEEFQEHYRTVHFKLSSQLPGLVSYQQMRTLHGEEAWSEPETLPEYDALSIYTFDSREAAAAAFASAQGSAVDADTSTFMHWPTMHFVAAEQINRFDAS